MQDNTIEFTPGETEEVVTAEEAVKQPRFKTMVDTLRSTKTMVDFFQSTWDDAKREFGITDDQMAELIRYNNEVRLPKADDQTDEDYDELNGLLTVPAEKLEEIFGHGSKLFGVDHTQTIDRVRYAANLFEQLFMVLREYRQVETAMSEAMDESEKLSVEYLRQVAENETDPEKRARAQASLDKYLSIKYLSFLTHLDDNVRSQVVKTFYDQRRIRYVLERGRNQLKRAKIPEMVILELSSFEKRCLPEKYHRQSNLMLLTLLQLAAYGKPADNQEVKRQVTALTLGLDKLIRGQLSEEDRELTMANILTFEDSFLEAIEAARPADESVT